MCVIFGNSRITDDGVKEMNLYTLYASMKKRHMNLRTLYASGNCEITDEEEKGMKLHTS